MNRFTLSTRLYSGPLIQWFKVDHGPFTGNNFTRNIFNRPTFYNLNKIPSVHTRNKDHCDFVSIKVFWRQFSNTKVCLNFNSKGPYFSSSQKKAQRSTVYYVTAVGVMAVGLSYAAVPLYRIFCQAYGYGGTTAEGHDASKVSTMTKVKERLISIRFNADIAASMVWNFKPLQTEIKVAPGETALAFYTAENPTDRPVIGISTYNVLPFEAGQYFNKIQCFCFEEQILNPNEKVHMPVFFYIDPEYAEDPKLELVDTVTLSYTFFEASEGVKIPLPSFARR